MRVGGLTAALVVLAWAVLFTALCGAVVTAPRWYLRNLSRYRLWRLRDALVDDIFDGTLPRHPAVLNLKENIEMAIRHVTKLRLIDVLFLSRLGSNLSPEAQELMVKRRSVRVPEVNFDEIDRRFGPEAAKILANYEAVYRLQVFGALMLGSWLGVARVATTAGRLALTGEWRAERRDETSGVRHATMAAASETRLGRQTWRAAEKAAHRC